MNKFRICAVPSIMLSFSGIALMSTEKTLGVVIMIMGLVPTMIFLTKTKREEKHTGSQSKQDRTQKREKKTILQFLIQKIKEYQRVREKSQATQPKKSILRVLIEYIKEKPATDEEIRQLRLEAEKYRLKADIAKSKAEISDSKKVKFRLGDQSDSSGLRLSSDNEDKISGLLSGAVKTRDVDFFNSISIPDIFESKGAEDNSDKEKEDHRKRTLGF